MLRLAAALLPCLACLAQPQAPPPVFRSTTNLVQLSVVAQDRHGNPITGLSRDDFEIQENGKRRDVAFFRFEGAPEPPRTLQSRPAGFFSNRVEYAPGPARNVTAILLDSLNTLPQDQMWVRAQTIRYLRALAPRTRVALFHLGKSLETFHDFTADADALRARLERTGVELQAQMRVDIDAVIRDAEQMLNMFPDIPDLDKTLRIQIENEMLYNADLRRRRVDTTLGALDALGRHLSGIPGRKSLVWIGGGISMLSVTGSMGMGPRGRIDSYESAVRAAAQRLAQQGVALYVVDARGLPTPTDASAGITATPPTRNRGRFEPQQQTEQISADPLPAAFTMAEITGGRVIRNSNDPGEGMRLAAADAGGAYSLAFYASTPPDGRWHTVKVKVRRSGVRLVTRQGFLAETAPASAAGWTEDEWQSALQDPLGSSAILLDARCEPVPGEPPGTIALILQFDLSALDAAGSSQGKTAEVEVGVAEKGPAGALGFHHEPRTVPLSPSGPASSMFAVKWKPASGAATIRAIVRDRRTGRYGSLDIPLPAPARPSAIQEITP